MTEDQLQAEFFRHVWNRYPELRRCMWAVPNGGFRNKMEAIKLKATGTLAGVWDLHLFYKGKFFIIETKVGKNTLSAAQKRWRDAMVLQGAVPYVYYTLEEGITIIKNILKHCG